MVKAREYLNRLIDLDNEIKRKYIRLKNLRSVAVSTAAKLKEEAVQQTRENNPLEKIMLKIIDLEKEINLDSVRLNQMKTELWEKLELLEDERHKRILWLKYAERQSGKSMSDDLEITPRHIGRIHLQAVEAFEKIFKN